MLTKALPFDEEAELPVEVSHRQDMDLIEGTDQIALRSAIRFEPAQRNGNQR